MIIYFKRINMLNNQDFTQDRSQYLGGSDIGALLGVSKYRTALDVWLEKTRRQIKQVDSLAIRFGQFAEAFVAEEYIRETGYQLRHHTNPVIHPEHSFMVGHIDRFVFRSDSDSQAPLFNQDGSCRADHLLEIKTASAYHQSDWGELGTDEVPMSYLVQCLWYLAMTNLDHAELAVLFGSHDFRIYQIERDLELEGLILDKAKAFWEVHVQNDCPPPPQNEADCHQLFSHERIGKRIEAPAHLAALPQKIHQLQEEIKVREDEISQMKQAIMETMQDAETLSYGGRVLATWKTPKPSQRLDTKRLSQDHPQLVQEYQVPIASTRRLLIKCATKDTQATAPFGLASIQ